MFRPREMPGGGAAVTDRTAATVGHGAGHGVGAGIDTATDGDEVVVS